MGLTIHYDFEFKGTPKEALSKLESIRNIAMDLPFKEVGDLWELDYSKNFNDDIENKRIAGKDSESYRWAKIQYGPKYSEGLIGKLDVSQFKGWVFTVWTGKGCEPTNIGLKSRDNAHWFGCAFTKTQYAEQFVRCHLLVVSILDVCKKFGILKNVSDEGEYYETRDLSMLGDNINESTKFIQQIGSMIKKANSKTAHIESAIDGCKNYVAVKKSKKKEKSRI